MKDRSQSESACAPHNWITIITAIFSAVAAVGSAIAAFQSVLVSKETSKAADRTGYIQAEMARPRVSITGGKYVHLQRRNKGDPNYRIQLTLKNSGERDASPFWLVATSDLVRGYPLPMEIASLPKASELTVEFNVRGEPTWNPKVYVAFAFTDTVPTNGSPAAPYTQRVDCDPPSLMILQPTYNGDNNFGDDKQPSWNELQLPPGQTFLFPQDGKTQYSNPESDLYKWLVNLMQESKEQNRGRCSYIR